MFKALNRMTNYRDKDKNTNKQHCRASPCLSLALQAYKVPLCGHSDCFSEPIEHRKGPGVRKDKNEPDPEP